MAQAFSPAFLKGERRALAFLPDSFRSKEARAVAVATAPRGVSNEIVDALRQHATYPAQIQNIERLVSGAAAVVTGQQVGLFLGPAFTLYKAASAIVTAKALTTETGRPCVPVFWLQSEDHDFDEVATCTAWTSSGAMESVSVAAPASASRCSMASLQLGHVIEAAVHEMASHLHGLPHGEAVVELLRQSYRHSLTWVESFAALLNAVFGESGLLLFDPRAAATAPASRQVYQWAFDERESVASLLLERQRQLESAGFETQVHVREKSPLFFFHPDGPRGPRYRLEPAGTDFSLVGATGRLSLSSTFVREALEQHPTHLSTSALLRPLLQDALLPTCATVVGPGEANYFAQLSLLYHARQREMPAVVPRARFRLIDSRTALNLARLELSAEAAESATAPAVRGGIDTQAFVNGVMADLHARTGALPHLMHPDVVKALARTRGTIERAASRLAGRVSRASQERDLVEAARLERIRQVLLPRGVPQERLVGWPSLAARVGVAELARLVLDSVQPFEPGVKTLAI